MPTIKTIIEIQTTIKTEFDDEQHAKELADKTETALALLMGFFFRNGEHEVMDVASTPDIDDYLDEWAKREAIERKNEEIELRKTKGEVG